MERVYVAYRFERENNSCKFILYYIHSITSDNVLAKKIVEIENPYEQFKSMTPHNALEILINQAIGLSRKVVEWKSAYPIIEGKVLMHKDCEIKNIKS